MQRLCNGRFRKPRYRVEPLEPTRWPVRGLRDTAPGRAASGLTPRRPSRPRCRSPTSYHPRLRAPGRSILVTFVDRTLNCVDCGVEFIHSAADQEYYPQKGFTSDPKRCASCRAYRRATRDGGTVRRPLDRRPARLRAHRGAVAARVLRRDLHLVRQPGAGAVQAAHGQAGLLLGLLPRDQAGLGSAARRAAAVGGSAAAGPSPVASAPCPVQRSPGEHSTPSLASDAHTVSVIGLGTLVGAHTLPW